MTCSLTPSLAGLSCDRPETSSGTVPGVAFFRNASVMQAHFALHISVRCSPAAGLNRDDALGEVRAKADGAGMEESWTGIVDVGSKPVVAREAVATGLLVLSNEGIDVVANGRSPKGDVREASTVAAIQAVKETPRTLPHCHPIPIEGCTVDWKVEDNGLRCTVSVRTHWTTGVEMEALCGVNAALLCAWDMLKPIEKDADGQYPTSRIEDVRVLRKSKGDPHD